MLYWKKELTWLVCIPSVVRFECSYYTQIHPVSYVEFEITLRYWKLREPLLLQPNFFYYTGFTWSWTSLISFKRIIYLALSFFNLLLSFSLFCFQPLAVFWSTENWNIFRQWTYGWRYFSKLCSGCSQLASCDVRSSTHARVLFSRYLAVVGHDIWGTT